MNYVGMPIWLLKSYVILYLSPTHFQMIENYFGEQFFCPFFIFPSPSLSSSLLYFPFPSKMNNI